MKKIALFFICAIISLTSYSQKDTSSHDTIKVIKLQECVISVYRANKNTPITFKDIDIKELNLKNVGQEPSFIFNQTPSINSYSDAGNEVGYSYFRLRGIDQTRINMTLDGIPLNEPEDQGVYFNNYPDFINSVSSVQIQRGIGTSSNGVASYGGSVNFQSVELFKDTSMEFGLNYGSFNTARIYSEFNFDNKKNFSFYTRISDVHTNGYKEHSGNDSRSFLFSAAYQKNKHLLKLLGFAGVQANEMAWLGAPIDSLKINPRYNANTTGETDAFFQSLISLQHTYFISDKSKINTTIYYNFLKGNYGFDLDNFLGVNVGGVMFNYAMVHNFIGAFTNYSYVNDDFSFYAGIHGNMFNRKHIGSTNGVGTYNNTGYKNEVSAFVKATYKYYNITFFTDVSYRHSQFNYKGDVSFDGLTWDFITPHLGIKYDIFDKVSFYYSIGSTKREPTRSDIFMGEDNLLSDSLGNAIYSNMKPEEVIDHEIGVRYLGKYGHIFFNFYHMEFKNEIVLNGETGPNGIALHSNVTKSERNGIELDMSFNITKYLNVSNNSSYSFNRIIENDIQFQPILSPSLIINQDISYNFKKLYICLNCRYQGKSYLDFSNSLELPGFYTLNAMVSYKLKRFIIAVRGNNLTNQKCYSNGALSVDGNPLYFIQAPTNFNISIKWTL
jgi:iron complex outermembrane receptor protein